MDEKTVNTINAISSLWPMVATLVVGCVTSIVGFFHLKFRLKSVELELAEHKSIADKNNTQIWAKIDSINTKFDRLFESIGEIKGMIKIKGIIRKENS
jgi:di/tripeptidase